tara:strand:- start:4201 stop:5250 length:1050 start_codon:yes stop_codon:yes gene_type:complete
MNKKIKLGINGLGRIGRNIFRLAAEDKDIEVVFINEKISDLNNWIYTIKYDTIYGKFERDICVDGKNLFFDGKSISTANEEKISTVPWKDREVDYIIDCTGIRNNVLESRVLLKKNEVKKILISHSPEEVDFTLILGVNEDSYDNKIHNLIASSICDATAIAPITKIIDENFKINSGYLTTLHPWLSYQNLMDGPSSSWSMPGEIYHHFALGRSSIGNLIPKPTTAMDAVLKVLPNLKKNSIGSFSYRTPTQIVGSADITYLVEEEINKGKLLKLLQNFENNQRFPILKLSKEPLVSLDFKGNNFSCVVDERWLDVINNKLIKCVLWYDNEIGYSSNIIRQVKLIHSMI